MHKGKDECLFYYIMLCMELLILDVELFLFYYVVDCEILIVGQKHTNIYSFSFLPDFPTLTIRPLKWTVLLA